MRVLQILPHLSKGGAERVVIELSNSLVEIGNEVTVLTAFPVDSTLNQHELSKRVRVQFVSASRESRLQQYLSLPLWIARNWKDLKTYDVIHCHLTYGLVIGMLLAIRRRVSKSNHLKLVATCHVVGVGVSTFPRVVNERLSYFFDYFVLMAQDSHWRRFITLNKRGNISVIANGISPNLVGRPHRIDGGNLPYTVGTISRLHHERKPWLFLETFGHLQNMNYGAVRFRLGGDGSERKKLVELSKKMGLDRTLSMPGLVKDPNDFLSSLDLYIALNIEDITGIAGLEAIFSGTPVIAIQLAPDYQSGACDWIWSSQDTLKVAEKIKEYLENPVQLSALAKEQYKTAIDKFSAKQMRDNYLSLYSS